MRKQLFAHYPTPDDEPFLSALRWAARVARNHELESWPHTGKQLMTPPGEPTVISEDITYQKKNDLFPLKEFPDIQNYIFDIIF